MNRDKPKFEHFEISDEFDRMTPQQKSHYFHKNEPRQLSQNTKKPWKIIIAVFLKI